MLFSNEFILDDKKCEKIFTAPVGAPYQSMNSTPALKKGYPSVSYFRLYFWQKIQRMTKPNS
ncbi:hypothetical protein LEP1GSC062_0909 [Leptospira alexanderi serovar Manhao 3 str. L 60]|uniref:Uncharacterized protein n=1 Tax=Leptospira alexanderi serovar Manhao 3 str. L 60 TaxID=1049759 RepID=V6HZN6_9LEPT|nr:hypothetical protein LEP1GSC062_0909 [Leptospira alexanderi serovar Manhao 3 str. L 60]